MSDAGSDDLRLDAAATQLLLLRESLSEHQLQDTDMLKAVLGLLLSVRGNQSDELCCCAHPLSRMQLIFTCDSTTTN